MNCDCRFAVFEPAESLLCPVPGFDGSLLCSRGSKRRRGMYGKTSFSPQCVSGGDEGRCVYQLITDRYMSGDHNLTAISAISGN